MKNSYMMIADNVRKLRKQKGYTQERLAEEVNISVSHLNRFENGQRLLSLNTYIDILQALDAMTMLIACPKNIEDAEDLLQDFIVLIDDCSKQEAQLLLTTMDNIKKSIKVVS